MLRSLPGSIIAVAKGMDKLFRFLAKRTMTIGWIREKHSPGEVL